MATRKPARARWTPLELKALPTHWQGDTLTDGDGLSGEVRVAADGGVSVRWRYAFRWQGKVLWFQCGSWPTVALTEVRARRDAARLQVKDGINPVTIQKAAALQKQQAAEAVLAAADERKAQDKTVRDLFDAWLADGVARKDSNAEIKRTFNKDVLPVIGDKPLRLISEADIRGLLRSVVKRGANRGSVLLAADLAQMLKWGEKRKPWRQLMADGNPIDLVEIEKIVDSDYEIDTFRERTLSPAEIVELRDKLTTMEAEWARAPDRRSAARPVKQSSQIAMWLCLATACRIGELLLTRREHVDLVAATWFIPRENQKGRKGVMRDRTVYLSPFALSQFRKLLQSHESEWAFPAKNNDESLCPRSVSKQMGDRQCQFKNRKPLKNRRHDNTLVLADGENGEWTPHDLRRTGATMMQALGVNLDVIDRCQGHVLKGSKVRRSYLHHDYADETRDAWRRLGDRLESILSPVDAPTGGMDRRFPLDRQSSEQVIELQAP